MGQGRLQCNWRRRSAPSFASAAICYVISYVGEIRFVKKYGKPLTLLAGEEGLEPPTPGFGVRLSSVPAGSCFFLY
jgi:hypothetical protein